MSEWKWTFFGLALLVSGLGGCERAGSGDAENPRVTRSERGDHGAGGDVRIETIAVAGNVHMLVGQGGNIGVSVGPDGILIIDDQFAPLADKIRAALEGLSQGELRFLLNTHHHGDHTGGNPIFGKEATIIAHDNVRRHLVAAKKPKQALPVLTFDRSMTVHFNGETIRLVHFAGGHTDGDSVIFFETSNVVHMGDHFFNGRFPFIDLNSGGSVVGYEKNVRAIVDMVKPDTKIIPGHGDLGTLEDLRTFHGMLTETMAHVRKQIAAGKTLLDIKKQGLPAKWDSWGKAHISTDRWLTILYEGLGGK